VLVPSEHFGKETALPFNSYKVTGNLQEVSSECKSLQIHRLSTREVVVVRPDFHFLVCTR
jgi:hypothetical protein